MWAREVVGPDELYPPVQYGWGWVLLAIGVLAALALAAWLLIALTRPRRAVDAPPTDPRAVAAAIAQLRVEYVDRIGEIEAAYRAEAIDARRANLELSRAVRAYVNEYSGLEAPVLSLDELEERGAHPALVDALRRHYYPSVFRRGPIVDPVAGAEAAREVVSSWH